MQEWIVHTMSSLGYFGIALLMFLENLFPPIPSELIMPLAGFTVSQGQMNMVYAIAAGVIGTVLGAVPWYVAGLSLGKERLGNVIDRLPKWLGVSGNDLTRSSDWFHDHGEKAVFFGRLVPGIRTLISIPAGISKMAPLPFFIFTTLGTILWTSFLTFAGYFLGNNYHQVEKYLDPISKIVLLLLVLALVFFVGSRLGKPNHD